MPTTVEQKPCNVCTDFAALRKENKKKFKNDQITQCPPDSGELGRSTWTFLHTMAAYYPEDATEADKKTMLNFINGLARFYPCSYCAEHLQLEMKSTPPKLNSNRDLSEWFCQMHNEVNKIQGKPIFDCSKVFERWRDGPPKSNCFPSK
jgi:mitochondrial FAD-linked sulfhydryl oxidase